jgi:hypothetical protein
LYRNVVTVGFAVIIGAWVFATIPKLALVFVAVLLSIVACEVYFDDVVSWWVKWLVVLLAAAWWLIWPRQIEK